MLTPLETCISRLGEQPVGRNITGRTVFFPWGLVGRGYVLDSEEQAGRVRRLLNREHFLLAPAVILAALTLGWGAGIVGAAIALIGHGAAVAVLFRGAIERVDRTLADALAERARGRWRGGLWLKAGAAAALAVYGAGLVSAGFLPLGIAVAAGSGLVAAINLGALVVTAGGR